MQEVRNSTNRLVCCVDKHSKTVEIVVKGCKTTVTFLDNGNVQVKNVKISA